MGKISRRNGFIKRKRADCEIGSKLNYKVDCKTDYKINCEVGCEVGHKIDCKIDHKTDRRINSKVDSGTDSENNSKTNSKISPNNGHRTDSKTVYRTDCNPNKKENFSREILLSLIKGSWKYTRNIVEVLGTMINPTTSFTLDGRPYQRENYYQALRHLKEKKLVKIEHKKEKTIIRITKKGKKRVLKYNLDAMRIKKSKQWDGLWRMVIFDIPEEKRGGRDALRSKLKTLGFYKLQKSVFVYPYECEKEITFIKEYYYLDKYVSFVRAKDIDQGSTLKDFFGLA